MDTQATPESRTPPEGRMTPGPTSEPSVTRREEELQIGKREVERGRVRLRKWVETEPVSESVELRQETATVERERLDRPAPGAELGEQEAEMTLRGEEPVVRRETVERERVSLRPEEETRQETVRGEARRERVEVEGDTETDETTLERNRDLEDEERR
jgi:stress response protein YsnF